MATVYRIFIKGLLTLLPITLTLYFLAWLASKAENILGEALEVFFPKTYFPGLGLAIAILLTFAMGLVVNNYLAAKVVAWIEAAIQKAPVVKTIYGPIKDVLKLFAEADNKGLKRCVLIDFPDQGSKVLGLVTRENFSELKQQGVPQDHLAVFIPYTFAVGGFTLLVARSRVQEVDIPAEKAMHLSLTGWLDSNDKTRKD